MLNVTPAEETESVAMVTIPLSEYRDLVIDSISLMYQDKITEAEHNRDYWFKKWEEVNLKLKKLEQEKNGAVDEADVKE